MHNGDVIHIHLYTSSLKLQEVNNAIGAVYTAKLVMQI
jgi:hypothetical protein